jgi:hypothetical protein
MATKASAVTDTEIREGEFDLEGWLKEGISGLKRTVRCRTPMVPDEFRTHTRAARKELLLAVRSLLDAAIQDLERAGEAPRR